MGIEGGESSQMRFEWALVSIVLKPVAWLTGFLQLGRLRYKILLTLAPKLPGPKLLRQNISKGV